MYARDIQPVLIRLAQVYPIVGITGPRQSGKTTLAKMVFPHLPYVSLEDLETRTRAQNDPRNFLAAYPTGAIFDEIQHVPGLFSYLQGIVDAATVMGRYVLTGSQQFSLNHHISQSLAGRMGLITLLPLSTAELNTQDSIYAQMFKGGYPRLHDKGISPLDFFPQYIQTYVERDVRQLKNIENLGRFKNFLQLCAGRVGQLVNLSSLAQDAGVSHTTVRQWLNILEASYVVFFLQPWFKNLNKRLVKMPKLYFYDVGLACRLLGVENEKQLQTHPLTGALFENLVILEILKARMNAGLPPQLYFWRDQSGKEVDLIGEWSAGVYGMEIKLGGTYQKYYVKHLMYFKKCFNEDPSATGIVKIYLCYTGVQSGQYGEVELLSVDQLKTFKDILWDTGT